MKKYFQFFVTLSLACLSAQEPFEHSPWNLIGAQERIDSIRKGTVVIKFEMNGKTLENTKADFHIELERHDFKFGVSMTQSRDFAQKENSFDGKEFSLYKERVAELFNFTTLGFYWVAFDEKTNLTFSKNYINHILDWARDNGIEVKGHPLMWHESLPKWVAALEDTEEVNTLIYNRIRNLLETYSSINYWDVYNEPVAVFKDHVTPSGITRWVADNGGIYPAMESLYAFVNSIDSTKVYTNNHYNPKSSEFFDINAHFIDKGVQYSAIGMQAHIQTNDAVMDEKTLWDMMQRYTELGKDIQFTELTITSSERFNNWKDHKVFLAKRDAARKRGENLILPSLPEYEDYQAAYIKDFYTLAFSHPSVTSLTFWNLTDKNAWRGHAGGLLDKDLNPKKAYNTLKELIKETWHTRVDTTLNLNKPFSFDGFYGDYTGTVTVGGKPYPISFSHSKDSTNEVVVSIKD